MFSYQSVTPQVSKAYGQALASIGAWCSLDKNHKIFYHFDSLEINNLQHALAISQKLNNVYSPTVNISFLNVKTPRQENYVDCGMHSLLNAVTLAAEIQKDESACLSLEIFEKCLTKYSEFKILTKRVVCLAD